LWRRPRPSWAVEPRKEEEELFLQKLLHLKRGYHNLLLQKTWTLILVTVMTTKVTENSVKEVAMAYFKAFSGFPGRHLSKTHRDSDHEPGHSVTLC
jgi:hypothetical protein